MQSFRALRNLTLPADWSFPGWAPDSRLSIDASHSDDIVRHARCAQALKAPCNLDAEARSHCCLRELITELTCRLASPLLDSGQRALH